MDAETYLLARRQIQDRLAARRLQLLPEWTDNGARGGNLLWWPVVERWILRGAGWRGLFGGIVTAGAGYAFSRLANRFNLNRSFSKSFVRLLS